MVGNGGFVLAGALGVCTKTGPAASASDSTFSTVASISGKSLKVRESSGGAPTLLRFSWLPFVDARLV